MGKILNDSEVNERAASRGLKPGTRLWAAGAQVDGNCFRRGNGPKNPAIYLRWSDIGSTQGTGKIEGEDMGRAVVSPGKGLSLFIEQTVQGNFNHLASNTEGFGKSYLQKLAKEEGYTRVSEIHWFKMTEGRVIPVGLEVVYDGHPPGHCTLTVTRTMTVQEFISLVTTHLGFDYKGADVIGTRA